MFWLIRDTTRTTFSVQKIFWISPLFFHECESTIVCQRFQLLATFFCKIFSTHVFTWLHTFTSHRYGLSLSPSCCCDWCLGSTLGNMWDVFHPSQPMPGSFPLGVFFHPQNCSKLFHLEQSHILTGLARTCSGWRKINGFTYTPLKANRIEYVILWSWERPV